MLSTTNFDQSGVLNAGKFKLQYTRRTEHDKKRNRDLRAPVTISAVTGLRITEATILLECVLLTNAINPFNSCGLVGRYVIFIMPVTYHIFYALGF